MRRLAAIPRLQRVGTRSRGRQTGPARVIKATVIVPTDLQSSNRSDPFWLTHAGQATCDRWMPRPPLSARRAESWRRGGGVQRTHAIEIVTVYKSVDIGHALSSGTNRGPGMPTCCFDDVTKTSTDNSDPWSFPILSARPILYVVNSVCRNRADDL